MRFTSSFESNHQLDLCFIDQMPSNTSKQLHFSSHCTNTGLVTTRRYLVIAQCREYMQSLGLNLAIEIDNNSWEPNKRGPRPVSVAEIKGQSAPKCHRVGQFSAKVFDNRYSTRIVCNKIQFSCKLFSYEKHIYSKNIWLLLKYSGNLPPMSPDFR